MDDFTGYRGRSLEFLKSSNVGVGDIVEVTTDWGPLVGTLVPRYQYDDDNHIVLKLSNGYNIGLRVERMKEMKRRSTGERPAFSPPPIPKAREDLPRVVIIGTGGTIASRIDYRTGAVRPATTAEELYALVPELAEIARIEPEILLSISSENIEPEHWSKLAERVARTVAEGAAGCVITHGTDTMGYTAAALTFALPDLPSPVILVGAQRSSDRPSSDGVLNLICSVSVAARANFAGVFLAMHENESDERIAIHLGTRVRKNHTSARDAFTSVGVSPAAIWTSENLEVRTSGLPARRKSGKASAKASFEPKVALLKFYPSMPGISIDSLVNSGMRAIILEGSGLGHINSKNIPRIRQFIERGGIVCMTSQCINGRTDLNVYDVGRDLIAAGVIPLEDMLAETALVKAMWVLANSNSVEEARAMMRTNLAGEITERTLK